MITANLRNKFWFAAAVWLLPVAWADAQATSTPAVSARQIAALIAQLGDDRAARREQASRELATFGLPAVPALRLATLDRDPEIANRARLLLGAVSRAAIENGDCLRWKAQLPAGSNADLHLAKDTAIFYNRNGNLHGLSLTDGSRKWEREWKVEHPCLALLGDRLICYTYRAPIQALNPATGDVLWQSDVPFLFAYVGDGILTAEKHDTYEHCGLSPEDGSVLWVMNEDDVFGPHTRRRDWRVVSLTRDAMVFRHRFFDDNAPQGEWHNLVAVDPATGRKMWAAPVDYLWGSTVGDGLLYTVTDIRRLNGVNEINSTKRVTAYDLKTGQSRPVELPDLMLHYNGAYRHPRVVGNYWVHGDWTGWSAYDLKAGQSLWEYIRHRSENDPVHQAYRNDWFPFMYGDHPAVVHDGAVVFTRGDALLAIDIATGVPRWKLPAKGIISWGPLERDGIVYVIVYEAATADEAKSAKSCLYAIDLNKASLLNAPDDETVDVPSLRDVMRKRMEAASRERMEKLELHNQRMP